MPAGLGGLSNLELIGLAAVLLTDEFNRGVREYEQGLDQMEQDTTKKTDKVTKDTEKMAADQAKALKSVGLAFTAAGAAVGALLTSIALTASRTEELSIILDVTATNARRMAEADGDLAKAAELTSRAVQEQVTEVKDLGITTQAASQLVALMIRYNLDWTKSTELAALAQDAATFAAQDSSEALQGLIHGITTLNPRVLRTYGILVSLEQEYARVAKETNRTTDQISVAEKQTIALNAALAQAPNIAGAYEAAMDSASKQIRSLKRDTTELAEAFGESLLPALNDAVSGLRDVLHWLRDLPAPVQATAVQLGAGGAALLSFSGALILVIPQIAATIGVLQKLALVQNLVSSGLLGPLGIVAGLIAAAGALLIYQNEVEKARRAESVSIAETTDTYAEYLAALKDAELDSYALSESLYEVARASEDAAEGLTLVALQAARNELADAAEAADTLARHQATLGHGISDTDQIYEIFIRRLQESLGDLTTAQAAVLADRDAVRDLGEALGLSRDELTRFVDEMVRFGTEAQKMEAALDFVSKVKDPWIELAEAEARAAEAGTDYNQVLKAMLADTVGLNDVQNKSVATLIELIALQEEYSTDTAKAVARASKAMVDAEEQADEDREKARADLMKALDKLEEDHAERVRDLLVDLAEVDEELLADQLAAEEQYHQDRQRLAEEYHQALIKIDEDLAQKKADLQRDLDRDLAALDARYLDKVEDARIAHFARLEALTAQHQSRVLALEERYAQERASIEAKYDTDPARSP